MDPLALLSNLHGDGPATLQRLRRHGCDTLAGMLGVASAELAPILGWPAERTERFLREADALARRLGDSLLDVEEDTSEPVAAPETRGILERLDEESAEANDAPAEVFSERDLHDDGEPSTAPAEGAWQPAVRAQDEAAEQERDEELMEPLEEFAEPLGAIAEPRNGAAQATETADPMHNGIRDEVIARWRSLDREDPPGTIVDTLVPHTPSAPLSPPGRALSAAGLDGLDPVRLRSLQLAGITTVEELAAADDLELHQRTGLPFTTVGRLTFLARRLAASGPVGKPWASAPTPNRPASAPEPGDAAGPFA